MLCDRVAREQGAKGHHIGQHLGVGAAADALGRGVVAGGIPVNLQQGADQRGLGRVVELFLVHLPIQRPACGLKGGLHSGLAVRPFHGHRIAVVQLDPQMLRVALDQPPVAAHGAGERILQPVAQQMLAVGVGAQLFSQKVHGLFCIPLQRQPVEVAHQPPDGVFALLRVAAVGRNAHRFHLIAAGDGCHGDVLRIRQGDPRRGGQHSAGVVRHHIAGHAALHPVQLPGTGLVQLNSIALVQDALFAVDERILAVRGEAQHRDLPAVGLVVQHVPVVGLLVQAEQQPDTAVERDAQIPDGLQRKQTGHHRAFVINGSPAIQPAALDLGGVGRVMPALALGHHVQMPQHRHHLVPGADLAPADVPIHVGGLKAQLMAEGQRLGKAGIHLLAKGLARQRVGLHTAPAHQPLERRHHLGPQRRHGLVQFFVHTFHPFCDSFHSLYYRTIAPAPQAPSSTKKRPRILHQKYPGALGFN